MVTGKWLKWREGGGEAVFQYIKAAAKKEGTICSLCLWRTGQEAGGSTAAFLMVKLCRQQGAWSPLLEGIRNIPGMTQVEPSSLGADEFIF